MASPTVAGAASGQNCRSATSFGRRRISALGGSRYGRVPASTLIEIRTKLGHNGQSTEKNDYLILSMSCPLWPSFVRDLMSVALRLRRLGSRGRLSVRLPAD